MEYIVIFEKFKNNYGAYAPDLRKCGVVGETLEEVRRLIAKAIEFHIEGLLEVGELFHSPHLHRLFKSSLGCRLN